MMRFEALEPRIMLSAALDVVFIDSALEDIELLRQAAGDEAMVIVADDRLQGASDAIDLIVKELGRLDAQARSLTILSHGDAGALHMAGDVIDAANAQEDAWGALRSHLSDDANLYLYGCDVARGGGQALLDVIAKATGADVFASDDVTGVGGDWELEAASTGDEAELRAGARAPLAHEILARYASSLAGPITTNDEAVTDEDTSISVSAGDGVLSNDTNDPALDQTIPGYSLDYDAAKDVDGNGVWETLIGTFDFALHGSVTRNGSPMTEHWGLGASYVFTGAGGGTMNSLEFFPGNPTQNAVTFEIWFRPDDVMNQYVLFESGATGDGISLSMDGDEAHFKVKDSGNNAQLSGAGVTDQEFNHLVGVLDVGGLGGANANTDVYLYLNGELIDSVFDVAGLNDWAGSNPTGLGVANGGVNFPSGGAFVGEIARFRMYEGALTEEQVQQNYDAIRLANYGLTIIDFDSTGASGEFSLGETGGFIYNPVGALDHLNAGETAIESVTYRVQDSAGMISTGTLHISVVGANDAPLAVGQDDVELLEDDPSLALDVLGAFSDVDDVELALSLLGITGDASFAAFELDPVTGLLTISPMANASGSVDIALRATDEAGLSADVTFSVTVGAVNDAPSVTAPDAAETETDVIFSATDGTAISIDDIDAAHALVRLDLIAEGGVITLDDIGGAILTKGDGTQDAEIRLVGTLEEINFAINNLRFSPDTETAGLTLIVNDLGAAGAGGELTASAFVSIRYEPVEMEMRSEEADDRRARAYFVVIDSPQALKLLADPPAAEPQIVRLPAALISPLVPDVDYPAGFGFPSRTAEANLDIDEGEGGRAPEEHENGRPRELAEVETEEVAEGRAQDAEGAIENAADDAPALTDASDEDLRSSTTETDGFDLFRSMERPTDPVAPQDVAAIALLPLLAMRRVREASDRKNRAA